MKKQFLGFTLSELLVCLGVIGLIAAFTVPKVLADTARTQTRMQLKEALNAIESLAIQGFAEEKIVENNPESLTTYIFNNIKNVKRICANTVRSQGCAGAAANLHWSNGTTNPGILLNNGSLIVFQSSPNGSPVTQAYAGSVIQTTGASTGEPNTCMYIMVYDTAANSGIPLSFGTNTAHLPLVIREGNPRGGPGTLLKDDYIWGINYTWLYQ
jgi:prepilin-type N-terminal cleavage/methylation domain-containing protein